jgi:hypothetical protein
VLLSRAEAGSLNLQANRTIEVIKYDRRGPPLVAKVRELINAAAAMTGTSPGATSSLLTTPTAGFSPDADKTSRKGPTRVRHPPKKGSPIPDSDRQVLDAKPDPGPKGSGEPQKGVPEIDDQIEEAKQTIRARFELLKDRKMLDERESEVGVLSQTAKKLKLGSLSAGGDLSEQLADHLTKYRDYRHLGAILSVFQRLRDQNMYDEARRISEIMDWMLPLCLPQSLAAEVWKQLTKDEEVLLRSGVGGTVGAELVVARLYRQAADFVQKDAKEPTGKRFVAQFENLVIDDSDDGAKLIHEIYVATHHPEVGEFERQNCETKLSFEEERRILNGEFEFSFDFEHRPSYCLVKLPDQEEDVFKLSQFLRRLKIPRLLFIGIAPKRDQDVHQIEVYVINNINTYKYTSSSKNSEKES